MLFIQQDIEELCCYDISINEPYTAYDRWEDCDGLYPQGTESECLYW